MNKIPSLFFQIKVQLGLTPPWVAIVYSIHVNSFIFAVILLRSFSKSINNPFNQSR